MFSFPPNSKAGEPVRKQTFQRADAHLSPLAPLEPPPPLGITVHSARKGVSLYEAAETN